MGRNTFFTPINVLLIGVLGLCCIAFYIVQGNQNALLKALDKQRSCQMRARVASVSELEKQLELRTRDCEVYKRAYAGLKKGDNKSLMGEWMNGVCNLQPLKDQITLLKSREGR